MNLAHSSCLTVYFILHRRVKTEKGNSCINLLLYIEQTIYENVNTCTLNRRYMRMLIRVISQTVKSGGNECMLLLPSQGLDSCYNFESLPISTNTDWDLIVSAFVMVYYHHYMILHYFMSDIS